MAVSSSLSSYSLYNLCQVMAARPFSGHNDLFTKNNISDSLIRRINDYLTVWDLSPWVKAYRRIAILPDPLSETVERMQKLKYEVTPDPKSNYRYANKLPDKLPFFSILLKRTTLTYGVFAIYMRNTLGRDNHMYPEDFSHPQMGPRFRSLNFHYDIPYLRSFLDGFFPYVTSLKTVWDEQLNSVTSLGALQEISIYNHEMDSNIGDQFIAELNKKNIVVRWFEEDPKKPTLGMSFTYTTTETRIRYPCPITLGKLRQINHLKDLSIRGPIDYVGRRSVEKISSASFHAIGNLTQLESLHFDNVSFYEEHPLRFLVSLKNLKALSFFSCKGMDFVIPHLPSLEKSTRLTIYRSLGETLSSVNCIKLQRLKNLESSFSWDQIADVFNAGEFQKIKFSKLTIFLGKNHDLFSKFLTVLAIPGIEELSIKHDFMVSDDLQKQINENISRYSEFRQISVEHVKGRLYETGGSIFRCKTLREL